ncbi:MAG: nucleoside hydrolase [Chthonomonadales bacterium]|nr:nucleoside hydrolase [Chthonomonadales bacterium]
MPLPIVLDTDIGTDIDDAYALLLSATSPELDLRAVLTVNGDTLLRARLARTLLDHAGRADVPVYAGLGPSLSGATDRGWAGHEGQGIDLAPASSVRAASPADVLRAQVGTVRAAGERLTLVAIGPLTNVAAGLHALEPAERDAIAGVVAMAATFEGFGPDYAMPEHNVRCDPMAVRRVLEAGVALTFVGLNVTRRTSMGADDVDANERLGTPLARDLARLHRVWFGHLRASSSAMHDPLAVAHCICPSLLDMASARAEVDLDPAVAGCVIFLPADAPRGLPCRVAVGVDADGFHRLFRARVRAACAGGAAPRTQPEGPSL